MTVLERAIFAAAAAVGAAAGALGLTWLGPRLINHLARTPQRPPEVWEHERPGAVTTRLPYRQRDIDH